MGKTNPEEDKRLAIAALLRECFHCIVKIILPHPVHDEAFHEFFLPKILRFLFLSIKELLTCANEFEFSYLTVHVLLFSARIISK